MENEYIEKIHRYLHRQMEPSEKMAFEAELAQNPALAADLAAERLLLRGLELHGDAALQKSILDTHNRLEREGFFSQNHEISTVSPLKVTFMKRIVSYAAAAVVLLVLGWFLFLRESPRPSKDELMAKFHNPKDPNIGAVIRGLESHGLAPSPTPEDTLLAALQFFDEGKYADAQKGLDSFLVKHPANDTATYYLALSHFNQSHYARALELLSQVSTHADFAFRYDAQWTLGLCYLQTGGDEKKAIEIYEALQANTDYPRHREAKAMKEMLNNEE